MLKTILVASTALAVFSMSFGANAKPPRHHHHHKSKLEKNIEKVIGPAGGGVAGYAVGGPIGAAVGAGAGYLATNKVGKPHHARTAYQSSYYYGFTYHDGYYWNSIGQKFTRAEMYRKYGRGTYRPG